MFIFHFFLNKCVWQVVLGFISLTSCKVHTLQLGPFILIKTVENTAVATLQNASAVNKMQLLLFFFNLLIF